MPHRKYTGARVTKTTRVKLPTDGKVKQKSKASALEETFENLWAQFGKGPSPVKEFRFLPPRLFRIDFAWPEARVAVEIEGGAIGPAVKCHSCGVLVRARNRDGSVGRQIRGSLGHTSGTGLQSNIEKYNLAALNGWAVLRFTGKDLKEQPLECVKQVQELIQARAGDERAIRQMSFLKEF